jgi:mono/diheme cytochrome c family protein
MTGRGGQSAGGAGGTAGTTTWTEIYTKFLTNTQYASNCNGAACHNPGAQKGYDFSSQAKGYTSVKKNTSQFVSVLSSGAMPRGRTKMPAADLALIRAWVAAGALDN